MAKLEAGSQIPEVRVTPDKYLTVRYAGASGDFNPIHVDEEFARAQIVRPDYGITGWVILTIIQNASPVGLAEVEVGGAQEQEIVEKISAVPGVSSVALTSLIPMTN